MAAPSSTTSHARSRSYRRQALIWLMTALLLGVATALVWMFSQTPAVGAKIENSPINAPQTLSSELEQPSFIESLHELDTDVQPISFEDTIRDLRNYPDEFKDKRYLLANKGKWTVQVMNVAENDVIVNYLESRDDRKKFSYFRYRDEDNQLRYMLTYGLMGSPQEAVGASKLIDFRLPADVRVLPEEINRYVGIIDNYERPQPIKDLSTRRARSVRLQPTNREVPARQEPEVIDNTDNYSSNQSANGTESIRQSRDTSETLSVNEERIVETDEGVIPSKDDKAGKAEKEANKLPAVPTPKPPNTAPTVSKPPNTANNTEKSNSNTNAASKDTNSGASKNNKDNIKELIEEKSN